MYIGARLILPWCLIPLGQERKKGEKERVPPYRECLKGLVSVLGEPRGRRNKRREKEP